MLNQTFELMLALIHLRRLHNKIYDSKRQYTIKYFGYVNIYYIGNSEADNKTSNPLSNQIMTNMLPFFFIKIDISSYVVPTLHNMEIFVVKGQTNTKSTIYRSL
jgi:hypothetical protein